MILKNNMKEIQIRVTWGKEFNVYPKSRTQKVPRFSFFGWIYSKKTLYIKKLSSWTSKKSSCLLIWWGLILSPTLGAKSIIDIIYNRGQSKHSDIFGALYTLSISILELNVKMAPEMSGFFNWLSLVLNRLKLARFKFNDVPKTVNVSRFWLSLQS